MIELNASVNATEFANYLIITTYDDLITLAIIVGLIAFVAGFFTNEFRHWLKRK